MNLLESIRGWFSPKEFLPIDTKEDLVSALMSVPEIREALSPADASLALDDVGWVTLGSLRGFVELNPRQRLQQISQARLYWMRDPLAHQAVRLWTDYAFFDQGMSFQTKDTKTQTTLDKFMNAQLNNELTSPAGQQQLSKKLLIDGEVFFALFQGENDAYELRTIDPMQITDLITDPDDEGHVLAYRRETRKADGTVGKVLFYADYRFDPKAQTAAGKLVDPQGESITLEKNVVIYHLKFDAIGKRGNSLLMCVLDWSREHRRFMEARVALTQSLAKFAWKLTAKIGQKGIDAIKNKLQSSLTSTTVSGVERNPPASAGSTYIGNTAADMTPMPRASGASDAMSDGRMLKLMFCAGVGIMEHYMGDGANANLAVATAMELPMLKQFGGYQQLWKDAWRKIFGIVLQEKPEDDPIRVDISLPEIVTNDLRYYGVYIQAVTTIFPESKVPSVLKTLLSAIKVENLDEVMDEIEQNKIELDKKAEELQKQMLAGQPPPAVPGGPPKPALQPGQPLAAKPGTPVVHSDADAVAALDRLTRVLQESPSQRYIPMPHDSEPRDIHITMEPQTINVNPQLTVQPMEIKVEHAQPQGAKHMKLIRDDKGRVQTLEVDAGQKTFDIKHDGKGRIETIEKAEEK